MRPFFLPMTCAGDLMGAEIPPTDIQFDFPGAGPLRQVRIASAAPPTPKEQAFVRDTTSARVNRIKLRLMVATCSVSVRPAACCAAVRIFCRVGP